MPSTQPRASRTRRLLWVLGGALVVVLVAVVISVIRPGGEASGDDRNRNDSSEVAPTASTEIPDLSRRIDGDPTGLGALDAPVVLIEFADYRCPFCGVFARDVLPTLIDDYVDAGMLRIEWRDTPIFGDESFMAAVAARAAGLQGLFWEYNAAIYAYSGTGHQPLPNERLIEIAAEIGVPDLAAFEKALSDPTLAAAVSDDARVAQALGVRSTPTFVIGQTPIMGAQPLEVFRQAVEMELTREGR